MSSFEHVRAVCLSLPGVTEQIQWGADLVFKVGGKMFTVMGTAEAAGQHHSLSLKATDEDFDRLTARPGFSPAPYLARAKWVAIEAFDTATEDELEQLISGAYRAVLAALPKKAQQSIAMAASGEGLADLPVPSRGERSRRSAQSTPTPRKAKATRSTKTPAKPEKSAKRTKPAKQAKPQRRASAKTTRKKAPAPKKQAGRRRR